MVREAAERALKDGRTKYVSSLGILPLREAIAAKTLRDSGFSCQASQVLVTNGGKHAVFTAFAALCDPGDEVICPAPYWTTYPEAITLAGGVPVVVDTDETNGFKVTVEQLDAPENAQFQPDVIFTNWSPNCDGLEVIKQIRDKKRNFDRYIRAN